MPGTFLLSSRFENPQLFHLKKGCALIAGIPIFLYYLILKLTVRIEVRNEYQGRGIYLTWHAYDLCTVLLVRGPQYRPFFILGHQKLISLIHSVPAWILGCSFFNFFQKKGVSGVDQIKEFFETESRLFIFSDSGGPYRKMKPGTLRIAEELKIPVIPVGFNCSRQWVLGKTLQQVLPVPGSTLTISFGAPLFVEGNLAAVQKQCEDSMKTLLENSI